MTEEIAPIDSGPAHEVLPDLEDGGTTPLQHKPQLKEPEPEAAKPLTASEAIKAAMAKVEKESTDKPEAKEEPKAKAKAEDEPQTDSDGDDEPELKDVEAEKPDKAGGEDTAKNAQSEGEFLKVPSRLLPRERDQWGNVPHSVKRAMHRLEAEFSAQEESAREATEFRESLREYDEMAKAANTSVKVALDRYVSMDKALAANFGQGLAQIAQSFNKNPTQAVAEFMRASGVSPQQLGAYLQGQPAQAPQQQPQQQRQVDPIAQKALQEVEQLKQQLAEQAQKAKVSQLDAEIIAPHAAKYPRFAELQEPIVKFLKSGMIPDSLSHAERLEVAQDMAERIYPAPVSTQSGFAEPVANLSASTAGKKSISGAPGKSTTSSGKPKIMSIRDAIAAASRAHSST